MPNIRIKKLNGKNLTFKQYEHHGILMWVRHKLLGLHREHCLCYSCGRFYPENRKKNCPIANELYAFDVAHSVTTPVWECKRFV